MILEMNFIIQRDVTRNAATCFGTLLVNVDLMDDVFVGGDGLDLMPNTLMEVYLITEF